MMVMNMQINRLFEIIMILMNKETVTAKELADHFGVSTRTIYRDIDTLSLSNIPIYTNKGSGGGISILPEFTLNKSLLSETEQSEILGALQSLQAAQYPEINSVITKLGAMFKNVENSNWVEIDFSYWGSNVAEKNKFNDIKTSILTHKVVEFEYVSSYGEKTKREVEPLKLVFKGQAWYLMAFCRNKQANRTFRMSRIINLVVTDKGFNRLLSEDLSIEQNSSQNTKDIREIITLKLKFQPEILYRVYDDFNYESIKHNEDGTVEAIISFPEGEWVYGYILSFGDYVKVLEPEKVKIVIKERMEKALKYYKFL